MKLNQHEMEKMRQILAAVTASELCRPVILNEGITLSPMMSMRDIFAAVVLHKLAPSHTPVVTRDEAEQIGLTAYQLAEAMLKGRQLTMPSPPSGLASDPADPEGT